MAALGDDLLGIVNKLQDLVFNTIGNDSLDLPQIVRTGLQPPRRLFLAFPRRFLTILVLSLGCCWVSVRGQVFGA